MKWRGKVFFFIIVLLSSCENNVIYSKFQTLNIKDWNRNCVVELNTSPIKTSGEFIEEAHIIMNNKYPYKEFSIIIHQKIYPSKQEFSDTLIIDLLKDRNNLHRIGLSMYEKNLHFRTINLKENDSLCVKIRHNMSKEHIEGVCKVGFTIRK